MSEQRRISKVVYHTDASDTTGTVWMDVTQKTVNATNLLSGETALKNDGTDIVGTLDPGGDYPIFTADYNPQTENSTITCNKTFSECYTDATKETPVIIAILNFMVDSTLQFSKSMLLASISTDSQLTYMLNLNQVVPNYTIVYNSNGTITESDASNIFQNLTISGSGTYPAPSNISLIAYHTVTVPSGSATTPATTVTANPSISVSSGGLITATASATKSVTPTVSAGYVGSGTAGTITVSGSNTQQLTTQAAKTVSPTESEQTAVASGVYTTGVVKVGAISSTYVGSGIAQKSSTDLTASGATVTAPAGYYSAAASKSVATGTAGTPTATKGTVSNHSVTVTPSVTNTTGYITGGTISGTAVTVTAAELESGTKTITENGTGISVSGYATVDVSVPSESGYKITITSSGNSSNYISYNNVHYYTAGNTIEFTPGDTLVLHLTATTKAFFINGEQVLYVNDESSSAIEYNYTLPVDNITVAISSLGGGGPDSKKIEVTTEHPVIKDYKSVAERTFSAVEDSNINYVGSHAFGSCINLTTCSVPNASAIYQYAFNGCSKLTTVYAPSCTFVGMYAFQSCFSLSSATFSSNLGTIGVRAFESCSQLSTPFSLSNCSIIGEYAFYSCYKLPAFSVSNCTTISQYAFAYCSKLSTFTGNNVTTIQSFAFIHCSSLAQVDFPNCTTIQSNAFQYCSNLSTFSASKCTTIGPSAFQYCSILASISLPACTSASYYAFAHTDLSEAFLPNCTGNISNLFRSCYNLQTAYFSKLTGISASTFNSCRKLISLYLLGSTRVTLGVTTAFTSTPIAGYSASAGQYGSIYVPASLYSSYISATNWVTYSTRFVSLTDDQIAALSFT